MTDFQNDLQALLADILDDSKPLPVPVIPSPATVQSHITTNLHQGRVGDALLEDPKGFIEALPPEVTTVVTAVPENESDEDRAIRELFGDSIPTLQPAAPAVTTPHGGPVNVMAGVVAPAVSAPLFTDSKEESLIKMPTFTAADFASTMDIRNFATLVSLNTSRWHAKVKDRQASRDAALASNANENSFETRKLLLVGADTSLKKIHRAIDDARADHYRLTLPWTTTGMSDKGRRMGARLLPNTLFVEYTTAMAKCKQAMEQALDDFVPQYPALILEAQKHLGKRFDAAEYPNASGIRDHFSMSFDFQPLPKGEDFMGLPKQQLAALAAKVNDNTRIMAEHAMQEVWQRMYEAVARMAERLPDPNKVFHATMVSEVKDVARLMAHLNITQDQKVEDLRQKIEKHLCVADAEQIRENPVMRQRIGAMAVSILQEMQT